MVSCYISAQAFQRPPFQSDPFSHTIWSMQADSRTGRSAMAQSTVHIMLQNYDMCSNSRSYTMKCTCHFPFILNMTSPFPCRFPRSTLESMHAPIAMGGNLAGAMRILDEADPQTPVLVAPQVMDVLLEDVAREVKDLKRGHQLHMHMLLLQKEAELC